MTRSDAKRLLPVLILCLAACSDQAPSLKAPEVASERGPHLKKPSGIYPNVKAGDMSPTDAAKVTRWIHETTAVMQSQEFDANFNKASQLYPKLFVSQQADLVASETILARLKTQDSRQPNLWWPEVYIILAGTPAARSPDQTGFGFEASRKAAAGPIPGQPMTGQIELGRLHLARFIQGDEVEKSCAINTMAHEISHTLSERSDEFWMHILDSEDRVTAPPGFFEASYFIGVIAQCTYLQSTERITAADVQNCLLTFSDPASGSRFKSLACDDFTGAKPITPSGRLRP